MKSALIRMLAIMALATSISAFAGTEKDKAHSANTKCCCGNTESTSAPSPRGADKTDGDQEQSDTNQEKSRKQMQIEEQDKQWLHDLQGIYGG